MLWPKMSSWIPDWSATCRVWQPCCKRNHFLCATCYGISCRLPEHKEIQPV